MVHTTCYALIIKGFEQDENNECNTNIIGNENGASKIRCRKSELACKCGRPKLETDQIQHRRSSNESNIMI